MRVKRVAADLGVWLGMLGVLGGMQGTVRAQAGQMGQMPPRPGMGEPPQPDPTMVRVREQQEKSRNQERQKKLEDDTARLYALAGELKDEVAKTNKDTLSVDVIKKADEIERLAHSVKEKMKG